MVESKRRARQRRTQRELGRTLDYARSNPLFMVGWIIVLLSLVLALVGPEIAPYPPEQATPRDFLQPPNRNHWLGTDATGMDIFSRIISAPRIDIAIALACTVLAMGIGVPLGVWAGYYSGHGGMGGFASEGLLRVMDVLQAFPVFILALALMAALGPSSQNVVGVLTFVNAPVFLRLTRSTVLSLRERPYIEAARCAGNSDLEIIFRHLLPNSLGPALVAGSVNVGRAILTTAGLSFVGAGVRVPTPEWGSMIAIGASDMITGHWWFLFFPWRGRGGYGAGICFGW